jgi:hypothetical protein
MSGKAISRFRQFSTVCLALNRAFISPIAPSDFASEKGHSQLPFLDMLTGYKCNFLQ